MSTTILYDGAEHEVDPGTHEDGRLLLTPRDLAQSTGWEWKPHGMCRRDECIPEPSEQRWRDETGDIDLAAFAFHLGQAVAHEQDHDVWAFGDRPDVRASMLQSLKAPDFTLPDVEGNLRSLSEYRGAKVFLLAWASWCGCKFDLPVWQVIYEELRPLGLEIVSVALDTAGAAAAERNIRALDIAERPEVLRFSRAWTAELWERQSPPTYPCLIDTAHEVADLYGVVNVPSAIWIDEAGTIVRPAEPAGVGDEWRTKDSETSELPPDETARALDRKLAYLVVRNRSYFTVGVLG